VKLQSGAATLCREGVHHARLRRLGTEDRWNNSQRSFESLEVIPTGSKKHEMSLPC
jgi:hypothetical protein